MEIQEIKWNDILLDVFTNENVEELKSNIISGNYQLFAAKGYGLIVTNIYGKNRADYLQIMAVSGQNSKVFLDDFYNEFCKPKNLAFIIETKRKGMCRILEKLGFTLISIDGHFYKYMRD